MKKEDIKTLITFIVLILGIFFVILISFQDKKVDNIDRKISKIFNKYSYGEIVNRSEELFNKVMKYLINNDEFIYEKYEDNKDKTFVINNQNGYKKIINFSSVLSVLSEADIDKFMEYKNIIYFENSYYILEEKKEYNYIGSVIEIDDYNDQIVTFKSINYYCDSYDYLGIIKEDIACEEKNNMKFDIILDGKLLKVSNIENLIKILE